MDKSKKYNLRPNRGQRSPTVSSDLPTPGTNMHFEDLFNFPFVTDGGTVEYLNGHGRIMFIVRGPSGTRKNTLASVIMSKFPSSELCSADDYFSEPFVAGTKTRETLKNSHAYCEKKVLKACQENKHPIIIKNTNMRKWEMQYYIDLAIEYCYTAIMAITLRKLSATAEVLEKTNTQGLRKAYFHNRLRQWEEIVPQYTGWMLSPPDTKYVMDECEKCFKSLAELEDFSKVFCTQNEGSSKDYFTPEDFPFCIAAYCDSGRSSLTKHYYLSKNVQEVYGKVFPLVIQAFVITKSFVAAVVHLEENMKDLVLYDEVDDSDLSDVLGAMSVNGDIEPKQPVTNFVTNSLKTAASCSRCEDEKIDTKNCSFIILYTAVNDSPTYPYIKNIGEFSGRLFSDIINDHGFISSTLSHTVDNNCKYCILPHDSWLILLPEKITLKSVFTGLYV